MRQRLLILTFLLVPIVSSFACSCGKIKKLKKNEINIGEVIFIGTVVEKRYVDKYTMVTLFKITENIGKTKIPEQYEIWSGRDCEPHIEPGDQWYIFGNLYEEKHWSIICSRSAQLTDRDFSHVLKKYRKKVSRDFNKNRARAKREIKFIRKLNS